MYDYKTKSLVLRREENVMIGFSVCIEIDDTEHIVNVIKFKNGTLMIDNIIKGEEEEELDFVKDYNLWLFLEYQAKLECIKAERRFARTPTDFKNVHSTHYRIDF